MKKVTQHRRAVEERTLAGLCGALLVASVACAAASDADADEDAAPEAQAPKTELADAPWAPRQNDLAPSAIPSATEDEVDTAQATIEVGSTPQALQVETCPENTACMFEHSGAGGQRFTILRLLPDLLGEDSTFHNNPCPGCGSPDGSWGDVASSVFNRTDGDYCFYTAIDFEGTEHRVGPGDFEDVPADLNDTFSSARPCP